jgi:hypothetical protein
MSEIKKSKFWPGDTRLPHENLNAYNDAVRQVSESRRQMADVVGGITSKANTVHAYNASGEDAPWRGICEISDTSNTTAQVEFVKPGGDGGVGQYGILLEPIKAGSIGRIAISGGLWEVDVSTITVNVGDTIGASDGSFDPGSGRVFEVVQISGDIAKVRFLGGGGGLLLEAQEDMTEDYDDTDDTTIANTTYSARPVNADGTLGDTITVIRPPGVEIRAGQRGVLSISGDGMQVFSPVNQGTLLRASEDMTTDSTDYSASVEGGVIITVWRTPGIYISSGQYGTLSVGDDNQFYFVPANMREQASMPLVIETRTDDPLRPATGRIWLRTDL